MRTSTKVQYGRLAASAAVALVLAMSGCSEDLLQVNGTDGMVTLALSTYDLPAPGTAARVAAPSPIDSAAVVVFRPNGVREISGGASIAGGGSVAISVHCIAESNKRIGVNLYYRGVMVYHGAKLGVDVVANKNTDVIVDVDEFQMGGFIVSPGVVAEGELFFLAWNRVPGAKFYKIQESRTAEFGGDIIYEGVVTDTIAIYTRPRGAHYFRVAPATPYAVGTFTVPDLCYVMAGGNVTSISAMSAGEVVPGEELSITGENLDYPDTKVFIGSLQCPVVSSQWDQTTVQIPLNATTAPVSVSSSLGTDQWPTDVVVQRIAYVSRTGTYFDHYKKRIEFHPIPKGIGVYEQIGIALVHVTELDWRDMSVFDVIVVANDTGTRTTDWGAGVPARAQAIVRSEANILAIGVGGAVYLSMTTTPVGGVDISVSEQTQIYAPDGAVPELSSPYPVVNPGPVTFEFCLTPEAHIALSISKDQKPAAMELYGQLSSIDERWPLAGLEVFRVGKPVQHYFWGYAGDPDFLTDQGADCLSNMIYYLYGGYGAVTPAYTTLRQ